MDKPLTLITIDGIRFLKFPELEERGLTHLFTTRDWDMGIATNLERHGNLDKVADRYGKLRDYLDAGDMPFYFMRQEHTATVVQVPPGPSVPVDSYPFAERVQHVDGLWTETGSVLVSTFADCVPVLLYDPVKRRQANLHSGWRGTAAGIVGEGIRQLVAAGSAARDIIVALGPHIRDDEFFVREDAVAIFRERYPECFPEGRDSEWYRRVSDEHYTINLAAVIQKTATDLDIRDDHFWVGDRSTVKETDLLHSWRRDGRAFGLMTVASRIAGKGDSA